MRSKYIIVFHFNLESLVFCVVFCRSLFILLFVFPSSMYGFWLSFWYLQIFLTILKLSFQKPRNESYRYDKISFKCGILLLKKVSIKCNFQYISLHIKMHSFSIVVNKHDKCIYWGDVILLCYIIYSILACFRCLQMDLPTYLLHWHA